MLRDTICFDNSCLKTIAANESRELIEEQYKLFCLGMFKEASGVYGAHQLFGILESVVNMSGVKSQSIETLYGYLHCRTREIEGLSVDYCGEQDKLKRGLSVLPYLVLPDKSDKIKFGDYKVQQLDEMKNLLSYFSKSLDRIGMSVSEENLDECDSLARFLTLKMMVYKTSIDYNKNRKWNGFLNYDGSLMFNDFSCFPQAESLVGFSEFFDSQLKRICAQKEVQNVKQ